jgi:hypothetical protein
MCIEDLLDSNEKTTIDYVNFIVENKFYMNIDPFIVESNLRKDDNFRLIEVRSASLDKDYYSTLTVDLHDTVKNKEFIKSLMNQKDEMLSDSISDLSLLSWTVGIPIC